MQMLSCHGRAINLGDKVLKTRQGVDPRGDVEPFSGDARITTILHLSANGAGRGVWDGSIRDSAELLEECDFRLGGAGGVEDCNDAFTTKGVAKVARDWSLADGARSVYATVGNRSR